MLNAGGTNDDQQPKYGIKLRRFGDLSLSYIRAKCSATVKNSLTNLLIISYSFTCICDDRNIFCSMYTKPANKRQGKYATTNINNLFTEILHWSIMLCYKVYLRKSRLHNYNI